MRKTIALKLSDAQFELIVGLINADIDRLEEYIAKEKDDAMLLELAEAREELKELKSSIDFDMTGLI